MILNDENMASLKQQSAATYKKNLTVFVIIAVCAIYCSLLSFLPLEVFWNTDGGNKFIIMQNLLYHGELQIANPAADLDPAGRFFPYSSFYFIKSERGIDSIFSPYFSWISQWLYVICGFAGLYIIPLLSGMGTIIVGSAIVSNLHLRDRYAIGVIALSLCTPLLFYSLTFWEMTLVTLLSASAFMLLLHRSSRHTSLITLFKAGLLLGAAGILREDIYVLIIAAAAAMLCVKYSWHKIAIFCGGTLIMLLPSWLWQYHYYGHWLGLHGSQYYKHNSAEISLWQFVLNQLNSYYIYLLKFNSGSFENQWYYIILFLPFAAGLIAGLFMHRRAGRKLSVTATAILTAGAIAAALLTVMLWMNSEPVLATIFTIGLFTASPFLLPLWLNLRVLVFNVSLRLRLAALIVIFYCAGITPLLTQNDLGIVWGPRHFIYLYPLLVPLWLYAAARLSRNNILPRKLRLFTIISIAALVLISILLQIRGISNLYIMKRNMRELNRQIAVAPPVVVSDIFWLPMVNAPHFYNKKFLQYNSGDELRELLLMLRTNQINQFSLVLAKSAMYRKIPGMELKKILSNVEIGTPRLVPLPGTDFMSTIVIPCRLKP